MMRFLLPLLLLLPGCTLLFQEERREIQSPDSGAIIESDAASLEWDAPYSKTDASFLGPDARLLNAPDAGAIDAAPSLPDGTPEPDARYPGALGDSCSAHEDCESLCCYAPYCGGGC